MTPQQIIQTSAAVYCCDPAQVQSKTRMEPIIFARHIAIFLIITICQKSQTKTGYYFNLDHSSVYCSTKAFKNLYKQNYKGFKDKVIQVLDQINFEKCIIDHLCRN